MVKMKRIRSITRLSMRNFKRVVKFMNNAPSILESDPFNDRFRVRLVCEWSCCFLRNDSGVSIANEGTSYFDVFLFDRLCFVGLEHFLEIFWIFSVMFIICLIKSTSWLLMAVWNIYKINILNIWFNYAIEFKCY